MGLTLNVHEAMTAGSAPLVLLVGVALFELTRRRFVRRGARCRTEIEKEIKRREHLDSPPLPPPA
jgi:hypothetical protein